MARIGKGQSVLLSGGMAMALLLAGCYSYPPLPEPVTKWGYTELKSGAHRGLPADCTMLTMAEAQSIALRNNPDYRSARHAMAAASARLYQSLTTYLPTLNATYDLTETRRNGGVMPAHVYSNKTLGFGAEWVVFNGLMGTMTALAARHDLRESEALERDARRLLLEAVGVAYNQVLLTREGIGISMADEEFNRKLLRETELKHEAGATALSEVLNFRIRVNDARSDLVRSEYSFATARSVLAELLG
jgi:outer membrane protein TolC